MRAWETRSKGFLLTCKGQAWTRRHAEEDRQQEGMSSQQNPTPPRARGRGEEHQVIRDSNQRKFNRQKSVNYRGRRRMVRSGITVKVVQCVVAVNSFGS